MGVALVAHQLNLGEAARAQVALAALGAENHVIHAVEDFRHIIFLIGYCFNFNRVLFFNLLSF